MDYRGSSKLSDKKAKEKVSPTSHRHGHERGERRKSPAQHSAMDRDSPRRARGGGYSNCDNRDAEEEASPKKAVAGKDGKRPLPKEPEKGSDKGLRRSKKDEEQAHPLKTQSGKEFAPENASEYCGIAKSDNPNSESGVCKDDIFDLSKERLRSRKDEERAHPSKNQSVKELAPENASDYCGIAKSGNPNTESSACKEGMLDLPKERLKSREDERAHSSKKQSGKEFAPENASDNCSFAKSDNPNVESSARKEDIFNLPKQRLRNREDERAHSSKIPPGKEFAPENASDYCGIAKSGNPNVESSAHKEDTMFDLSEERLKSREGEQAHSSKKQSGKEFALETASDYCGIAKSGNPNAESSARKEDMFDLSRERLRGRKDDERVYSLKNQSGKEFAPESASDYCGIAKSGNPNAESSARKEENMFDLSKERLRNREVERTHSSKIQSGKEFVLENALDYCGTTKPGNLNVESSARKEENMFDLSKEWLSADSVQASKCEGSEEDYEMEDRSPNSKTKSEMEEGELEPEDTEIDLNNTSNEDTHMGDGEVSKEAVFRMDTEGEFRSSDRDIAREVNTEPNEASGLPEIVALNAKENCKRLTLDLLGADDGSSRLFPPIRERPSLNLQLDERRENDTERELTLSLGSKSTVAGASERDKVKANNKQISNHSLGEQRPQRSCQQEHVSRLANSGGGQYKTGRDWESEGAVIGDNSSKRRQKRMKVETSLDISLSLASPEPERSIRSVAQTQTQTQTNSDGFTASASYTQSQSLVHNMSCSLNNPSYSITHTTLDNQEYSCAGSQQFSQGNEGSRISWPAYVAKSRPHGHATSALQEGWKSGSSHQRWFLNEGVHQNLPSMGISSKGSLLNDRDFDRVNSTGVPPYKVDSLHGKQIDLNISDNNQGSMQREGSLPVSRFAQSRVQGGGDSSATLKDSEKIGLEEIVTERIAIMARKLLELPDSLRDSLKEVAKDMLGSIERREEFVNLQKLLNKRTDLTQEALSNAHRTQLEILVALKTETKTFIEQEGKAILDPELIEIFLQTRCRNYRCQNSLPVYGCECRVCSQNSGFCSDCMCIVCSKFDMSEDTCRWVGCDVCAHWCHTDCALQMSYIAPGPSVKGGAASETTVMQYKCVLCEHPAELFGFVTEVFSKFSHAWNAETLAKQLDYVRRIFAASEDMKGKQLCWKAEEMFLKLEKKVDHMEVCKSMLRFFTDGDAKLEEASGSAVKPKEKSNCSRDAVLKSDSNVRSKVVDADRAHAALKTYDRELEEKRLEAAELQNNRARKKAEIDEFESIVRVKTAEAKMFQVKADEARQGANGLQEIVLAMCKELTEEYNQKYVKLQLNEAEGRCRSRLEELQALERAQLDYLSMKKRMEGDIKDLLKKMETVKQRFF